LKSGTGAGWRIAQETGKVMRWVDEGIQLAACGSSQRAMPTYASWEYEVLDHCFNEVDFISLHAYFRNDSDDIQQFFTVLEDLDSFIREVAAICDAVAAKRRSKKRIMLSLDEWNVWYKAHTPDDLRKPGWPKAPKLIEEIYNFEDALIVGGALITMINNADRVKAACIAQLVNVIGPIMTQTGGPAWRQTIFHPFGQASRHAHGEVLRTKVETETYSTATHADLPFLLSSVVHDSETGTVTIFALNRHPAEELELEVEMHGFGAARKVTAADGLHHKDLKAINSVGATDEVSPKRLADVAISQGTLRAKLKPLSWNVIVTSPG
jgi:alpha-N-arabinofuranosidase